MTGMVTALADTYVASCGHASVPGGGDRGSLDDLIRRLAARGREAWAGVEVADELFAAWLAERAPDEGDPAAVLAAMHTDDLYLACACAQGDSRALALFETKVLPAAGPAVARIDSDRDFVEEVLAEMRVRLLVDGEAGPARIRSYIGRGPLTSWVQVGAMRVAYGMKRRGPGEPPEDADRLAALPFAGADAELERIREEFAEPFQRAFGEALATLSARDRNVLRLHLVEGLNTESIGRMYRVHRATVARWIAAVHQTLLSETRRRLGRELGLDRAAFDSFMRLVQSQLEVSIVSALGD